MWAAYNFISVVHSNEKHEQFKQSTWVQKAFFHTSGLPQEFNRNCKALSKFYSNYPKYIEVAAFYEHLEGYSFN